jgi:predicted  nucleic acid-binding Zn-ribbon protein
VELEAALKSATDGATGEVDAVRKQLRFAEGALEESRRTCEALEADLRAAQERVVSGEAEASQRQDAAVEAVKGQAKKVVEKLKEEKRVAIAAAAEDAALRASELSVASARVSELEAAVASGKSELDALRQKYAEQESELRMQAAGVDQIQGQVKAMKESEAVFQARARELEAALAALRAEEAASRDTQDAARKAWLAERAELGCELAAESQKAEEAASLLRASQLAEESTRAQLAAATSECEGLRQSFSEVQSGQEKLKGAVKLANSQVKELKDREAALAEKTRADREAGRKQSAPPKPWEK